MKLYLIGGLGADARVFQFMHFENETQVLVWIPPKKKESLKAYVQRLLAQINQNEPFGILGVSFGGIVAVELSKIVLPKVLILVSSVACSNQLPKRFALIRRTKILRVIPEHFLKPPSLFASALFGTKQTKLLTEIISDTSPKFIKWALNAILEWKSYPAKLPTIRIHGDKDRIIPLRGDAISIEKAGHFMVVDRAHEVSRIVKSELLKIAP